MQEPLKSEQPASIVKYGADDGKIKVARYQGEVLDLTVAQGCVTVGTSRYYLSNNLPDGTKVQVNVVNERRGGTSTCLLVRDVLKFGSSDLSAVPFTSRFELLDLLCTSFPDEYGFKMFGGRCVAPYVYVALPITYTLASKCQDPRLVGVTEFGAMETSSSRDVTDLNPDEEDVDGLKKYPPVVDESRRVMAYKPLIQAMIRKLCKFWRDAYLKAHQPGQLPFSAEDLMQQGLMEVAVALRKYNSAHASKAKESTFVYRHVWNRFGHIVHKYSKPTRGYGVQLMRDFIDEDGNITSAYDLGEILPGLEQ